MKIIGFASSRNTAAHRLSSTTSAVATDVSTIARHPPLVSTHCYRRISYQNTLPVLPIVETVANCNKFDVRFLANIFLLTNFIVRFLSHPADEGIVCLSHIVDCVSLCQNR